MKNFREIKILNFQINLIFDDIKFIIINNYKSRNKMNYTNNKID